MNFEFCCCFFFFLKKIAIRTFQGQGGNLNMDWIYSPSMGFSRQEYWSRGLLRELNWLAPSFFLASLVAQW